VDLHFTHFLISVHGDDCVLLYMLHCFIHHRCDIKLRVGVEPEALDEKRSNYKMFSALATFVPAAVYTYMRSYNKLRFFFS
jgi:hypothetical protein